MNELKELEKAQANRVVAVSDVFKDLEGCRSHSCVISPPSGMGTNSSCKCYSDRLKANIVFQRLGQLKQ
jgi:hypothetical protein